MKATIRERVTESIKNSATTAASPCRRPPQHRRPPPLSWGEAEIIILGLMIWCFGFGFAKRIDHIFKKYLPLARGIVRITLFYRERSLTPAESEVQFKAYLQKKLVEMDFSASPTSLSPSSSLSTPPNSPTVSKHKHVISSGDELMMVQGDHSGCFKPPVDNKTTVVF